MNKVTSLYVILLLITCSFQNSYAQEIQRVRIDFQSPSGYSRALLLGFTPDNAASDGMDYGYDALCPDESTEDLNWIINDQRYVIQGVGEFHDSKTYPFGLYSATSGNIQISLNALENFETPIDVFIYDAATRIFHKINATSFNTTVDSGNYFNRLFITFQNTSPPPASAAYGSLSISENSLDQLLVRNLSKTKEVLIDTQSGVRIKKVEILDVLGKKVANIKHINNSKVRIPVKHIYSKIIIVSVFTDNGIIRKKLLLN